MTTTATGKKTKTPPGPETALVAFGFRDKIWAIRFSQGGAPDELGTALVTFLFFLQKQPGGLDQFRDQVINARWYEPGLLGNPRISDTAKIETSLFYALFHTKTPKKYLLLNQVDDNLSLAKMPDYAYMVDFERHQKNDYDRLKCQLKFYDKQGDPDLRKPPFGNMHYLGQMPLDHPFINWKELFFPEKPVAPGKPVTAFGNSVLEDYSGSIFGTAGINPAPLKLKTLPLRTSS